MQPSSKRIAGQESWVFSNDTVEVSVTRRGGMMAPVRFHRDSPEPIEPYFISAWQEEEREPEGAVTDALRGDFFCLPFGWPSTVNGVSYGAHGESSSSLWDEATLEASGKVQTLQTSLRTARPAGTVTKRISIVAGHNALYISHRLDGYEADVPLGHHASLECEAKDALWEITTSPHVFGMTDPALPDFYWSAMYFSLRPLERIHDLTAVPTIWRDRPTTDCSRFPARPGFVDHLQLNAVQDGAVPAWTAAVRRDKGFLWYSLKDPRRLPSTLIWMDNGGRHDDPFLGRNRALGLEEVCAYFRMGYASSVRDNVLKRLGVPTTISLEPREPTEIRAIQGAVPVPADFDRVADLKMEPGRATFLAESGASVSTEVSAGFIAQGASALQAG